MSEIRSIYLLTRDEIVRAAREQADAGEAMSHGFEPGSAQACTWERVYLERRRELDDMRCEA